MKAKENTMTDTEAISMVCAYAWARRRLRDQAVFSHRIRAEDLKVYRHDGQLYLELRGGLLWMAMELTPASGKSVATQLWEASAG